MLSASELQARAKAATNVGHHERALSLLDQARARATTDDERALIAGTRGYALLELGRLDLAARTADDAVALAGSGDVRGIVLGQRALVRGRAGARDEALADFGEAIALLAHRPEFLGRCLLNRGTMRLRAGDVHGSAEDFAGAMAAFTDAGLAMQAAKAGHNLGYASMLAGDLVPALRHLDRSRRELGRLSAVNRAFCAISLAEAMLLAGLREEGLAQLAAAAASLGRGHARRSAAEARLVLARHLVADRPGDALAHARRAVRLFRNMGADAEATAAESIVRGCLLALGRDGPPVREAARDLVGELDRLGLRRERDLLRLRLADAEVQAGNVGEFLDLTESEEAEEADIRLLAAEVGCRRDVARGRPRDALERARRALEEYQVVRAGVGSLDLSTSLSQRTRRIAALALDLAVSDGDPALVLAWVERTRAATSRIIPVRPPQDQTVAGALAELRRLAGEGRQASRQEELRREIREACWDSGAARAALEVVPMERLRAETARRGAAWVGFVAAGDGVWALVVGALCRLLRLDVPRLAERLATITADLDAVASGAASGAGSGVSRVVLASLRGELAALADHLVAPWLGLVGDRPVALSPTGALHRVPWSLLPGLAGRAVSIPRGATEWVAGRREGGDDDASIGPRPDAPTLLVAGPRLHHADREVAELGDLWGPRARALGGQEATAARVGALADGARVVHIAAHGARSAENPLFSSVDLADGPLYAYDVDRLRHLPDLVVLSACDVGTAATRADDPLGLPVALLHAGVRAVIAPVTRVADDVARRFAVALHTRLLSGQTPDAALAGAVACLGDAAPAPFCCFGDGSRSPVVGCNT